MRILRLGLKIILVGMILAACIPLLWLICSAFEPQVIVWQAKRIASGRPYCIVVSDPDHPFKYREVRRMSELKYSRLTTRLDWGGSIGPVAETYYALLILQKPDDVWNWSKRYLNFRDDVQLSQFSLYKQDFTKFCIPTTGFAERIH